MIFRNCFHLTFAKTIKFYCETFEHENLSGNGLQRGHFSTSLSNHRRRNEKMFTGKQGNVLITLVYDPSTLPALNVRDCVDFKSHCQSFKNLFEGVVWNWYFPIPSWMWEKWNMVPILLNLFFCEYCFLTHDTGETKRQDDAHTACSLGFHPLRSFLPPFVS